MAGALVWITYFSLLYLRPNIFASLGGYEERGCGFVHEGSRFTAHVCSLYDIAQFLQIAVWKKADDSRQIPYPTCPRWFKGWPEMCGTCLDINVRSARHSLDCGEWEVLLGLLSKGSPPDLLLSFYHCRL